MKTRSLILVTLLGLAFAILIHTDSNAQEPDPLPIYLPHITQGYDYGFILEDPIAVELQPWPFSDPYLVVDSSGRPHILWDTYSSYPQFIYHTNLNMDGWTTPQPIAQTLGVSKLMYPPVPGNEEDIHFVWHNTIRNPGALYRIMYNSWNGLEWGEEVELLGDSQYSEIFGQVRLNEQGIPNVIYSKANLISSDLFIQHGNGTDFSARIQIDWPTNSNSSKIVQLDNSGGVRFYWDDIWYEISHFAYWKNGGYATPDQAIYGRFQSRKSVLDQENNLHLFRSGYVSTPGGNVTGLYHQCLRNDQYFYQEQVLTGQKGVSIFKYGLDDQSQFLIAWQGYSTPIVNIAFWDGCQNVNQKGFDLPDLPNGKNWGTLASISRNKNAGKTCFLFRESSSVTKFWMICARTKGF